MAERAFRENTYIWNLDTLWQEIKIFRDHQNFGKQHWQVAADVKKRMMKNRVCQRMNKECVGGILYTYSIKDKTVV
jgi:hypothetical protein